MEKKIQRSTKTSCLGTTFIQSRRHVCVEGCCHLSWPASSPCAIPDTFRASVSTCEDNLCTGKLLRVACVLQGRQLAAQFFSQCVHHVSKSQSLQRSPSNDYSRQRRPCVERCLVMFGRLMHWHAAALQRQTNNLTTNLSSLTVIEWVA